MSSDRALRIAHVITKMAVGGAQESVLVTATGLPARQYESVVLSGVEVDDEGTLWSDAEAAGAHLVAVPHLVRRVHPVADLRALVWLVRWFRQWRPDIVHTHSSKAGLIGRIAARLARVPSVVHSVHGWSFNDEMGSAARAAAVLLERVGARFADAIVVESSTDLPKGLARRIGSRRKYVLIRNGIDLERFRTAHPDRTSVRQSLGVPADAWLAGTVGRLADQKDPIAMVDAWRRVRDAVPDGHFVWIGDGPLRSAVESRVAELGLSSSFHLAGVRRDVADVLASMDAFALSSLWEGLPRTLTEAMAAGVPAVATAVDGTVEAIDPERTGLLVPPRQPRELAAAMLRLHDDPDLCDRVRSGARDQASKFDRKVMLEDLGELYTALASGGVANVGHRPLVIAHVISGLGVGGAEKQLAQLVTTKGSLDARHVVFSLTSLGTTGQTLREAGIEVHALEMPPGRLRLRSLLRLRAALRGLAPDLVQTWLYHGDLVGGVVAWSLRLPVVWNVRMSAMAGASTKRHTLLAARASAAVSRVIPKAIVCNSQAAVDDHGRIGFDRHRMTIIPNGVDGERFRPDGDARRALRRELGVEPDAALVGLVGRFDPQKDHRTFLDAMALVVSQRPDVHAVLCGEGVEAARALARVAGGDDLDRRVHTLGARTDIEQITAALDIAVSTSSYGESYPNAIAEAMACEVPVIVTDLPASVALVDGDGHVVPVGDHRRLAATMLAMLDDPAERARTAAAGRERVLADYGVDVCIDRYRRLYDSVRSGRG